MVKNSKVYTVEGLLEELEALGNDKVKQRNHKNGAGSNQFGVKLGDIRKVAKNIKTDHQLGLELWKSGNIEAQLLSILIITPKMLEMDEVEMMVKVATFLQLSDWLNSYVVKKHPNKEELRKKWMKSGHPMLLRAGWNLTSERVAKNPEGLDLSAILDRIESELGQAPPEPQWTMNNTLAGIGIHFKHYRERAISIGESLGVYRDYPVSKGCTSPFAPIWINEIVSRQS